MDNSNIVKHLKEYVSKEILEGQDMGLDATTPLLEWGIINSIEIARLVVFIENQWNQGSGRNGRHRALSNPRRNCRPGR